MPTWTLVLFLYASASSAKFPSWDDPIVIPGFATKEACDSAGDAIRKAEGTLRAGPSACVEVKPAACTYPRVEVAPLLNSIR